jgi:hypothetical protein
MISKLWALGRFCLGGKSRRPFLDRTADDARARITRAHIADRASNPSAELDDSPAIAF